MPMYEYQCSDCSNKIEVLQKVSDQALTTCPACQSEKLSRLVSTTGFQLKGGGWYVTDYANKKSTTSKEPQKPVNTTAQKESSISKPTETKAGGDAT